MLNFLKAAWNREANLSHVTWVFITPVFFAKYALQAFPLIKPLLLCALVLGMILLWRNAKNTPYKIQTIFTRIIVIFALLSFTIWGIAQMTFMWQDKVHSEKERQCIEQYASQHQIDKSTIQIDKSTIDPSSANAQSILADCGLKSQPSSPQK